MFCARQPATDHTDLYANFHFDLMYTVIAVAFRMAVKTECDRENRTITLFLQTVNGEHNWGAGPGSKHLGRSQDQSFCHTEDADQQIMSCHVQRTNKTLQRKQTTTRPRPS